MADAHPAASTAATTAVQRIPSAWKCAMRSNGYLEMRCIFLCALGNTQCRSMGLGKPKVFRAPLARTQCMPMGRKAGANSAWKFRMFLLLIFERNRCIVMAIPKIRGFLRAFGRNRCGPKAIWKVTWKEPKCSNSHSASSFQYLFP